MKLVMNDVDLIIAWYDALDHGAFESAKFIGKILDERNVPITKASRTLKRVTR